MTKIAKSEILRLRGEEPKKKEKKDYKTLALDLARMVLDGDRDSAEKLAQQITQNEKAENSAFSIQPSPAPPKPIKTLVFPKPVVAAVTSNIVSTSVIPPPATKVSCCGCGKSDAGLVPYDGKAYCAACLPVGAVSPIKRTLVVQPPKQKAKRALIANAGDSGCIVNNPAAKPAVKRKYHSCSVCGKPTSNWIIVGDKHPWCCNECKADKHAAKLKADYQKHQATVEASEASRIAEYQKAFDLLKAGKTAHISTFSLTVDGSKVSVADITAGDRIEYQEFDTAEEALRFLSKEDKQLIGDLPADFGQTQGTIQGSANT
jgi:hypothetical protein